MKREERTNVLDRELVKLVAAEPDLGLLKSCGPCRLRSVHGRLWVTQLSRAEEPEERTD